MIPPEAPPVDAEQLSLTLLEMRDIETHVPNSKIAIKKIRVLDTIFNFFYYYYFHSSSKVSYHSFWILFINFLLSQKNQKGRREKKKFDFLWKKREGKCLA